MILMRLPCLGILNPATEDDFKNKLAIQNYLNIYELISVAVRKLAVLRSGFLLTNPHEVAIAVG